MPDSRQERDRWLRRRRQLIRRFRWVWYSGGHAAYLRDPATLEEIGGWFARHLS